MSIEEKIIPGIDIKLPNTIRVEFIKLDLIVEISLSFKVFDLDPAMPKSRPIKTYMSPGLIWNIFLSFYLILTVLDWRFASLLHGFLMQVLIIISDPDALRLI